MKIAQSTISGTGLFADRNYQEGYVIGIINGPVVSREQATDSAIEPQPGLYIETEDPWKYINHSCRPNLRLLGIRVIYANRDIVEGEELYLDYSDFIYDDWKMNCECHSPNCRRLVQAKL